MKFKTSLIPRTKVVFERTFSRMGYINVSIYRWQVIHILTVVININLVPEGVVWIRDKMSEETVPKRNETISGAWLTSMLKKCKNETRR